MNIKTSALLVIFALTAQGFGLGTLLLIPVTAKATTQDSLTDADFKKINENVKVVLNYKQAQSQQLIIEATKILSRYHYDTVAEALFNRLRFEVLGSQARMDVIEAVLESLEKMANYTFVQKIKGLQEEFEKRHSYENDDRFEEIEEKFRLVVKTAAQRMTVLAVIKPPSGNGVTSLVTMEKKNLEPSQFMTYLEHESLSGSGGYARAFLNFITAEITDQVKEEIKEGKYSPTVMREKELTDIMDILVQMKGRAVVLTGPLGVGTKAIINQLAYSIINNEIPKAAKFQSSLGGAEIIAVEGGRFDLAQYLEVVKKLQAQYEGQTGKKQQIILVINNFENVSPAQVKASLPYFQSEHNDLKVIGMAASKEFIQKFKNDEEIINFLQIVGVEEFSQQKTVEVIKSTWAQKMGDHYQVKFSPQAIKAAVKMATRMFPDLARPEGPIRTLQAAAIRNHRMGKSQVDERDVYMMVTEKLGYPADVHSAAAFKAYIENLTTTLKKEIAGQDEMIDSLVKHFAELLQSDSTKPKVIQLIGTSGVGKTLLGEKIAELAFGNKNRFLTIDGGQFKEKAFGTSTLFGAGPGYISSDKTSGMVPDWLDDASRGRYGGVILINEAEKMNPDIWTRFMELFDTGVVTGADGKTRYARNHLFILTSNRGAKLIFPDSVKLWSQEEIKKRREGLTAPKIKEFFTSKTSGDDEFKLPPEVVGRIDDFIIANPISQASAVAVGEIEVRKFVKSTEDKLSIDIKVSDELVRVLALTGFSITDGARPISRQIQSYLQAAIMQARSKWNTHSGMQISLDLEQTGPSSQPRIKISTKDQEPIYVSAPYIKPDNPLLEKETVNKLLQLETNIKKRIIGQDALIRSASQAIVSQFGDVARKNPISIFAVGSTGTGKTEFAKALAEALYGSAERTSNIFLGGIGEHGADTEMTDVFGSKPGYAGAEKTSLFEQALISSPNGGVIVFDEASNMGGNNKSTKEALFKKFYNLLDEGRWVSMSTGKVYDLRNYVFVFTGNDGEKLFQGISSDDIRLATWKENNSRVKVRALLREAGVPEAFIGRMSDAILMKPIVRAEKVYIAEKLLKNQIERFESQHKGVKINYDNHFVEELAKSFFSQDQGARSLRNVIENRMGGVLIAALIENGYEVEKLQGLTLKLTLKDNRSKKPYAAKNQSPRKIELGIEFVQNNKTIKASTTDVVEFASAQVLMNKEEARATAFHEAGHALLNEPALTGARLAHVTIVGGTDGKLRYLGYARYEPIEHPNSPTYESTIMRIAQLYAGSLAQQMGGYNEDAGWSNDLETIRLIASQAVLKFGFEKSLLNVQLDEKGEPRLSPHQQEIYEKKKQEMISKGERLARMVLNEQWQVILLAQAELMQKGFMTGERFLELKEKALKSKFGTRTNEEFMKLISARDARRANGPGVKKECANILQKIANLK